MGIFRCDTWIHNTIYTGLSAHLHTCTALEQVLHFFNFQTSDLPHWANQRIAHRQAAKTKIQVDLGFRPNKCSNPIPTLGDLIPEFVFFGFYVFPHHWTQKYMASCKKFIKSFLYCTFFLIFRLVMYHLGWYLWTGGYGALGKVRNAI